MPDSSQLRTVAIHLRTEIAVAIANRNSLGECIERCPYGVFIKSIDDTIAVTNCVYNQLFLQGNPALSRHAKSYLDKGLLVTSELTDRLILGNCTLIEFEHVEMVDGREVELHTVKLPLDGIGHPTFSLLGVTKLVRERARADSVRVKTLRQYVAQLEALDACHSEYIVLTCKGATTQEMSEALGCCRRTVEKYKKQVLKALGLNNPTELVLLACRLQDAGFGEYGIFELEPGNTQ